MWKLHSLNCAQQTQLAGSELLNTIFQPADVFWRQSWIQASGKVYFYPYTLAFRQEASKWRVLATVLHYRTKHILNSSFQKQQSGPEMISQWDRLGSWTIFPVILLFISNNKEPSLVIGCPLCISGVICTAVILPLLLLLLPSIECLLVEDYWGHYKTWRTRK